MKIKSLITIWGIIVLAIITAQSVAAFTPAEQAEIDTAVGQAVKEGLFPEILYKRINEGIARKVPFEKIILVTEQKNSAMRELKRFCAESKKSSMPVPWTQENAEQLLLAMQNGLTGQDISFFHRTLSAKINRIDDFMDILKLASQALKRGVSREFLKQYALALAGREPDALRQRQYFALLANTGTQQMSEVQQKALLRAITEGRNYRDIEQMLRWQKDGENLNRQDRKQSDELRQRIHGVPGRENSQQGKEGRR